MGFVCRLLVSGVTEKFRNKTEYLICLSWNYKAKCLRPLLALPRPSPALGNTPPATLATPLPSTNTESHCFYM